MLIIIIKEAHYRPAVLCCSKLSSTYEHQTAFCVEIQVVSKCTSTYGISYHVTVLVTVSRISILFYSSLRVSSTNANIFIFSYFSTLGIDFEYCKNMLKFSRNALRNLHIDYNWFYNLVLSAIKSIKLYSRKLKKKKK